MRMNMYTIEQVQDNQYTIYELRGQASTLRVAPERGGIIIGFEVQGDEVLFLNKKTFYEEDANVRGGIPILFPIFGQLEAGKYEWEGKVYNMKNHGFARNLPWEVVERNASEDKAMITLRLQSSPETLTSYPFDFEVIFTYILQDNTLTIEQEYKNKSSNKMPIYGGFHPYFSTSEKNLSYETDAEQYLDYNDMKVKSVHEDGLDLTNKVESFVLLNAKKKGISFPLPELNRKVHIKYGDEFKYVYLWTEQDQDFVCVEPAMGKTDEFNRKEELLFVEQGKSVKTMMTVTVE